VSPRRRAAGFLTVLICLLVSVSVGAQESDDFVVPRGISGALGGPHAASGEGFEALFTNTSGLAGVDSQFALSELTIASRGPIFSITSLVLETLAGTDFGTLLARSDVQNLFQTLNAELQIVGPLSFGYVGEGMGYGIYNVTHLSAESVGVGGLQARLGQRFVLRGGYGLDIPLPPESPDRLSAGIGIKGFVRGDVVIETTILSLDSLISSISPALLTTSPFELQSGIGLDLGIRYQFADLLATSLTVEDLYTPTARLRYDATSDFLDGSAVPSNSTYQTLPQRISLGLAYTPDLGTAGRYVQDLTLLFDYRDIFDFWINPAGGENVILKFGAGVEATLLEILAVRAGFSRGLFSAGLGLDLTVFELNAAMFGSELSSEPGLRSQYNLVLGVEFRN
jgi:hypothetical protein